MEWVDFKADILRMGFKLCPTGKEQRGLLKFLEACYSENSILLPEKEAVRATMCHAFDYLSECLSGRREWYTA